MSRVQLSKFGTPLQKRKHREVNVPVDVRGGLHTGIAPQDLPEQFSPALQNFVPTQDGYITPRSGLSKFSDVFGGPILGGEETFDVSGNLVGFVASATSLFQLHPENQVWSELSYIPSVLTHLQGAPSGTSTDYWNATAVFDAASEEIICVASNNTNSLKYFEVNSATTTFSDFSFPDSLDSLKAAKDVTAINDRLVFFNTLSSAGTRFPTRVYWSARGLPKSYSLADGAGFEDLVDMKGQGQAAVRFKDFLLLFTESEIWRATPTLDTYAFRFDRVVDSVGCPFPRTIARTPSGVVFLGIDREVYITNGAGIQALGPVDSSGPSRIQRRLRDELLTPGRSWALYNETEHRYELYFAAAESPNAWPTRALFYSFPDATWWEQKFPFGLTFGLDLKDPATLVTWEDISQSWDDIAAGWDSFGITQGNRRPNVFSSEGTSYRANSLSTTDDGTEIDVRWRSRGFRNQMRKTHLTEVWMDYDTDTSSSMTLHVGSARSASSFDAGTAVSLTSQGNPAFVPVWKTDSAPLFEIRTSGQPLRVASFQAKLQDASKF